MSNMATAIKIKAVYDQFPVWQTKWVSVNKWRIDIK